MVVRGKEVMIIMTIMMNINTDINNKKMKINIVKSKDSQI